MHGYQISPTRYNTLVLVHYVDIKITIVLIVHYGDIEGLDLYSIQKL